MNELWQVPAVAAALIWWLALPPDGLMDAAHREALRRTLTPKSVRTYTNQDLPAPLPVDEALVVTAGAPVLPAPPIAGPAGVADANPPNAEAPKDEAWWRARTTAARAALDRDELMADALQTRVNTISSDVASRDDPYQRNQLRLQLQKAVAELDRLQKIVLADRTAIENLQTDARRAGVPPGWLR